MVLRGPWGRSEPERSEPERSEPKREIGDKLAQMRRETRTSVFVLSGALTMVWAMPAWAGDPARPPVQRPSVRTAEPEPIAVAPESETPPPQVPPEELVLAPAIEPSPASLPAFDATLPSYDDPDFAPPVAREVPRDGRGRLVIGSIAVLGGAAFFAGSTMLAVNGVEPATWGSTLVLGAGATVTGGLLLYGGRKRLLAHREWAASQTDAVPSQGLGLVASGGVLLIAGAAAGMSGTILWMVSAFGGSEYPIPQATFGVGLGSLAVGTALIVVGMNRHKRFQSWRDPGAVARLQLLPSVAPLPGGGQIGLSGRF
jgi:hypothetical protein